MTARREQRSSGGTYVQSMTWQPSLEQPLDPRTLGLHRGAAAPPDSTGEFTVGAIAGLDDRCGVPVGHVLSWLVAGSIGWVTIISGALMMFDLVK